MIETPETITLPFAVYQQAVQIIGRMPWDQVDPLMHELMAASRGAIKIAPDLEAPPADGPTEPEKPADV